MRPTIPASNKAPGVTYLPSLIRSCRGLQSGKMTERSGYWAVLHVELQELALGHAPVHCTIYLSSFMF